MDFKTALKGKLEQTGFGQFGVFFYGPQQTLVPFGDGFLCIGGGAIGVFRLNPPELSNHSGISTRVLDLNQPPASSGNGQIVAGSTWNFQYWYRDPNAGGAGFNLTDALSIAFTL